MGGGGRRLGTTAFEAKVFVTEPPGNMVAIQDGGEQFEITPAGRVKSRRVVAVDSLGFDQISQFAIGGCRIGDMADARTGIAEDLPFSHTRSGSPATSTSQTCPPTSEPLADHRAGQRHCPVTRIASPTAPFAEPRNRVR